PASWAGGEGICRAVPAAALDGDHGHARGLRPHQRHQDGNRRRAHEHDRNAPTRNRTGALRQAAMDGSDAIPEFRKSRPGEGDGVTLTNLSAFSGGSGRKSAAEIVAIIAVAVIIIGGIELALRVFQVPQYILPTPSAI